MNGSAVSEGGRGGVAFVVMGVKEEANVCRAGEGGSRNKVSGFSGDRMVGSNNTSKGGEFMADVPRALWMALPGVVLWKRQEKRWSLQWSWGWWQRQQSLSGRRAGKMGRRRQPMAEETYGRAVLSLAPPKAPAWFSYCSVTCMWQIVESQNSTFRIKPTTLRNHKRCFTRFFESTRK
jgi:hypothetical protein